MAAATQAREARSLGPLKMAGRGPIAAATTLYAGTMVAPNASGEIVAATVGGNEPLGVILEDYDNSAGAAGDLEAEYFEGVFAMVNDSGANAIGQADLGQSCGVLDNQTVDDGTVGVVQAGWVRWYDAENDLVYVHVGDPNVVGQ